MMNTKEWRKHLISKPNAELIEAVKKKYFYGGQDVDDMKKEIKRRKEEGTMRKDAGKKKKPQGSYYGGYKIGW